MTRFIVLVLILSVTPSTRADAPPPTAFSIITPDVVLSGIDFTVELSALGADGIIDTTFTASLPVHGIHRIENGVAILPVARFERGKATLPGVQVRETGEINIHVEFGGVRFGETLRSIPGILSILPPLFAILLALLFRQVIVALFAGIWLGALFLFNYNPFTALLKVLDHFVVQALADPDHAAIIIFSMMFGGMVGIISKNGGTFGIADRLITLASSPRRGQLSSWLLGIVIFFDDYANTLIVGNTMRPITDKLRISREKLAYIVDSTAAPISSLFFISTWIGYEVGLIDAAITSIDYHVESAYWIFIDTIPYRFYPLLTLVLGFVIAFTGRDFGPMLKAERRARLEGRPFRDGAQLATDLTESTGVLPPEGIPKRWWNGAIPILTVLVVGIIGLYATGVKSIQDSGGTDYSFGNIIGSANSYQALQWAALISCIVALLLSVSQRLLTVAQALDAWFMGLKSMLFAMLILILAWGIGQVTKELHTADFLVQLLKGNLAPQLLPVLTFLVAAVISFATGTSWGTMGILMPIVIPLAAALSRGAGYDVPAVHVIMLGTVSSVLAGAVFGDHCSPISDTTILSSMASGCDHVDHVRTQLPYALLAATTGMLVGDIPTAFGLSPYISILVGGGVVFGFVLLVGRKDDVAHRVIQARP